MAFIGAVNVGSSSEIEGSISETVEGQDMSVVNMEETAAFTIPAGARYLKIYNAGFVHSGDMAVNATVNGADFSPGNTLELKATYDREANKYLELPSINGNGNGARLFITYSM